VSVNDHVRTAARSLAPLLFAATLLAGCATPYGQGTTAYRQGRYAEAVARFQTVLAEDSDRLDALIGLGLAHYKLGAWDDAIGALSRAVAVAPGHGVGRLFLGLAYLQRGDDGRVAEHLTAYRELSPEPRTVALVDRARHLLRGAPLSAEVRTFIAASLEGSVEWQRELGETRRALQDEEFRHLTFADRVIYVVPRCR